MSSGDELAKAVTKKRVLALEFLVIVCEASDGLGASPGPPGRPLHAAGAPGLQTHCTRRVSPTQRCRLHRRPSDILAACEALKVSKFRSSKRCGRTKDELWLNRLRRDRLKMLKNSGPMTARGLSGKAGESSHQI